MNKPLDGPTPIVGADKIDWRPAIERARKYADSAPVRCRAAVEAAFQQGYGMGRFDGASNLERIAAEAVRALEAAELDARRYRKVRAIHLQTAPDAWIRTGDDLDDAADAISDAVLAQEQKRD